MKSIQVQVPEDRRSFTQKLHDNRTMVMIGVVLAAALIAVAVIWSRSADDSRDEFAATLASLRQRARVGVRQEARFVDLAAAVRSFEVELPNAPSDDGRARTLQDIATWSFRASLAADNEADGLAFLDKAEAAIDQIESDYPESVPATRMMPRSGSAPTTFTVGMRSRIAAERKHRKANAYVHPKVDSSRYALIETAFGPIKFGFFPELAPKHVENFVKLAKEGFYNGLLIHRVGEDFMIQTGDPNSRDRNAFALHGQGGPGYSISPEPARFRVRHLTGVVSTAKAGGALNESGSQFFICVAPQPNLDKGYTPFGEVIEGLDPAIEISKLPTMKDTAFADHPVRDVVIRSISIWKDGAIEPGHTWKTEVVGTPWKDPAEDEEGSTPPDDGEDDEDEGGGDDESESDGEDGGR